MSSTLIAHVDCQYRTREQLLDLPTPEPTDTWRPVAHHELVSRLIEDLDRRNIKVTREQYAVGGVNYAKLFGVIDLASEDTEIGNSLGLRTANDKTMKAEIITASRVFVCDNMAFSGSDGSILLSRKHTKNFDVSAVVPPAIDMYLEKSGAWRADINRMREFSLTDSYAKELVYDAFMDHKSEIRLHLIIDVNRLYFYDEEQRAKFEDRSLWSLNNAFTEAVKKLKALRQQRVGVEIGRYFSRVLNHGR
jgi:hypothetical protein